VVEFGNLSLKLLRRSPDSRVPPNVNAQPAKVAVPADVIEMTFCIDHSQIVSWPYRGGIAVNGLGSQRVSSCVDDQSRPLADDDTSVYAPGGYVSQSGHGIAMIRDPHIVHYYPLPASSHSAVYWKWANRRFDKTPARNPGRQQAARPASILPAPLKRKPERTDP
jgi:hypothetical protein